LRSKILTFLGLAATLIAATFFLGSPANANPDANCGIQNGHCIYWGQSYNNSYANVVEDVSDYPVGGSTVYKYQASGQTGYGQYLGNNNGSNRNYLLFCTIELWYNPGYSGYVVTLAQYSNSGYQQAGSGLGHLLNNLRSSKTGSCSGD